MAIKRLYGESDDTYKKRSSMTGYTYEDSAAKKALRDQIMNREKFQYDLGTDVNYQQAKEQYQALGKIAMNDTIGKASALTGGYGNSYATSAGQQAYNEHLKALNETIPQYYAMALDAYQREGDEMLQKYNIYDAEDQQGYARHMDAYNVLLTLAGLENSDAVSQRNYDYQVKRDKIADKRYDSELAYQKERDAVSDKQWEKNYVLSAVGNSGSSLKAPTQKMYDEALEAWNSGGDNALDRYLATLPDYDIELLSDHASKYGDSWSPLMNNAWEFADNGGNNWGGGIDENGKVKFGKTTYTLKDLYEALKKDGVSDQKATDYILELQRNLGITKN